MAKIGAGAATGYNINVNFPACYYDKDMLTFCNEIMIPIAQEFNPELVVISAGFDAVEGDPLGDNKLSTAVYGHMTKMLSDLVKGKVIMCLEGGYNVDKTAEATCECLKVLNGQEPSPIPIKYKLKHGETLDFIKAKLAPHWKCMAKYAEKPKEDSLAAQIQQKKKGGMVIDMPFVQVFVPNKPPRTKPQLSSAVKKDKENNDV